MCKRKYSIYANIRIVLHGTIKKATRVAVDMLSILWIYAAFSSSLGKSQLGIVSPFAFMHSIRVCFFGDT